MAAAPSRRSAAGLAPGPARTAEYCRTAIDAGDGDVELRAGLDEDRPPEDPVLLCAGELLALIEDALVERGDQPEQRDGARLVDLGERQAVCGHLVEADVL